VQRALNQPVTIVTSTLYAPLAAGAAVWHAAYAFNANGFAAMSNFATCFDQYRIKRMKLTFDPTQQGLSTIAGVNEFWSDAKMFVCIDTDDATAFAATSSYESRPDFKLVPCFAGHSKSEYCITFIPKCSPDVGAITQAGVASPWLDTANLTVPYYGVKIYHPLIYAGGFTFCNLYVTAEIELRRQTG